MQRSLSNGDRKSREKSLDLRATELKNEIESKKKRLDYLRTALEETRRQNSVLKQKYPAQRALLNTSKKKRLEEYHELFQAAAKEQAELRSRLLKAVEAQKRDAKLLEEALKKLEAAAQRRSAALRGDDADTPWAQAAARERAAAAQLLALQEESGSITEYNELQEQCSKAETQLEAVSIQLKNVLEQEQRARANYLEFLKQDEQGKLRTQANLLALALSDAEMRMHTKKQFFDFSLLGEQQQGFSSSFLRNL
mmetsp:Transcript_23469/g.28228  ORF Transcript_23469/g.28228 Transcript_23469/m.28228 type:complete len:253 (+) Transcript_23469:55-813(+)